MMPSKASKPARDRPILGKRLLTQNLYQGSITRLRTLYYKRMWNDRVVALQGAQRSDTRREEANC